MSLWGKCILSATELAYKPTVKSCTLYETNDQGVFFFHLSSNALKRQINPKRQLVKSQNHVQCL